MPAISIVFLPETMIISNRNITHHISFYMKRTFLLSLFALFGMLFVDAQTEQYECTFNFSTLSDQSGTYTATLHNGASITTFGGEPVLSLGSAGGYLDLGSSFGDVIEKLNDNYTISVNVYVPEDADIQSVGNVVWSFANTATKGFCRLDLFAPTFNFSADGQSVSSLVFDREELVGDHWYNFTLMKRNSTIRLFVCGNPSKIMNKTLTSSFVPAQLDKPACNYLGRDGLTSATSLKGMMLHNFTVINYDVANLRLS
jgi:hypothetical protein